MYESNSPDDPLALTAEELMRLTPAAESDSPRLEDEFEPNAERGLALVRMLAEI